MKGRFLNSTFSRILSWVLLIQVVNISIDPVDPLPAMDIFGHLTAHEDLSINDIESIYELFSEQCFNVDIPEQDEEDDNGVLKVIDFYFSETNIKFKDKYIDQAVAFFGVDDQFGSVVLDNTSPPPKLS